MEANKIMKRFILCLILVLYVTAVIVGLFIYVKLWNYYLGKYIDLYKAIALTSMVALMAWFIALILSPKRK